MSHLTSWLDDLLACEDEYLPEELEDRILARGEAARERLLAVALAPEHRAIGSLGDGIVAVHALELLGDLPPDAATAERLVKSLASDEEEVVAEVETGVIASMGEIALPHLLRALPSTADASRVGWLSEALATCGVRSDEVFAALCAALERFPDTVASSMSAYGDDRALPLLLRLFDAHEIRAGNSIQHEQRCIGVADAIEELGGELSAERMEKLNRSIARQSKLLRRRLPAIEARAAETEAELAALRHPGPNDPCPCGSGKKFKKCHEGDEEFLDSIRGDREDA